MYPCLNVACATPGAFRTYRASGEVVAGIKAQFAKGYLDRGINEPAKAPVQAVKGLCEGDAQKLEEALNIKAVKIPWHQ